jgi:uncharacterized membrane protein YgcG
MSTVHLANTAPAITQQPQSVSVQTGQSFSLSAAASGSALVYQWYKDGTAVAGATTSSYSVSNAATADAGSYTMTAKNSMGTATSSAATVTVSIGSGGGGGSSGGGGGGGGAPSEWFCGAFALLAVAHGLRRRYQQRVVSPGAVIAAGDQVVAAGTPGNT